MKSPYGLRPRRPEQNEKEIWFVIVVVLVAACYVLLASTY